LQYRAAHGTLSITQTRKYSVRSALVIIRAVGFLAIAIASMLVAFSGAPKPRSVVPLNISTSDVSSAVSTALSGDTTNQAGATSAPQQQVVNGWTARDLLAAIGRGEDAQTPAIQEAARYVADTIAANTAPQRTDDRVLRLLALIAVALCWYGFLTPLLGRFPQPIATNETDGRAGGALAS
jgi:hypothetical protein